MPTPRSVARDVLRLAVPAVLTSLLQTGVFLADRLLLGRYSQDALASMQVQGPLLWSLFGVFGGLLVGVVPLVARCVGAKDPSGAEAIARTALRVAFVLGSGVALSCIAAADPIIAALGPASPELRDLSKRYVTVALLGFPQMFLATTAATILAAAGNTRTPFAVGVLTNGFNVLANLVLIFGVDLGRLGKVPALGVTGSATGSALAFTLEASLLLWVLGMSSSPVRVRRLWQGSGNAGRETLKRLLRLSLPAFAERLAIHAGYLLYTAVITALGAVVMASNQALITLESICFLSADGFGIAAAAIVGQSLGRGEPAEARRAAWLATAMCAAALSSLGMLLWLGGPELLSAFVPAGRDGSAMIRAGTGALPLLALSQPFMAVGVVLAHALRGAGDTRSPLLAAVMGGALVRVPLAWWLGTRLGYGLQAVWMASAADWVLRAALLTWVFRRGRWVDAEV